MASLERQLLLELQLIYGGEWFIRLHRTYDGFQITKKGSKRSAWIYSFDFSEVSSKIRDIGEWVVRGIDISDAEIIEETKTTES